ncbi:MAG: patatin family protein [Bacteroidaceae bacterium]|nr:patatin family protein [Bacteroidaceae bacterium]
MNGDKKEVVINKRSGLVLEGGGMRGIFTSGVLDNFMDRGIRFPYTIGVSAGACNGISYMSGQRGRAKYGNIDLLEQYNYIGLKQLLLKGNIMDFNLLFHVFPTEISPYDYDALARSKEIFEMVTTSCKSGKACYFDEKHNPTRIIDIIKASSSLPFVSPISYVDGEPMLDGGIADSIPLLRAQSQGFTNNVVVLTRNKGYRKSQKPTRVPFFMYRKYPALRDAIRRRNAFYNEQIALVEQLEEDGKITVIRPERPIEVDRMERNIGKLTALYEEGYSCADKIKFTTEE